MAHEKFHIPLECDGKKYQITVQIENPGHPNTVWMAYGSDYIDPMLSWSGFGDSVEAAVLDFLNQYQNSSQSVYRRVGNQNILISQFDPNP